MSEWIEYTGSDEQIAEMNAAIRNSNNGVLLSLNETTKIIYANLHGYTFDKYLICNPHPRADMICQQARTGQPVWIRYESLLDDGYVLYSTTTPDWNIHDAEYSFTEFKD